MIKSLTSLLTSSDTVRELVLSTSEKTGFTPELLEKDLYLSAILHELSMCDSGLVFKGGTCLNKCLIGYYRLSEDLDFVHLNSGKRNRNQRKNDFNSIEKLISSIIEKLPGVTALHAEKFDQHQQMRIILNYSSFLSDKPVIKIEVTHRFPFQKETVFLPAKHCFTHPVTGETYENSLPIPCIDLEEAAAEKIRACCTRKEPAIRDFFDLWYIQQHSDINMESATFKSLVKTKLHEAETIILSIEMIDIIKRQFEAELSPTLNRIYNFDLNETVPFALSFVNK